MRRALLQAAILVLVSTAIGLGINAVRRDTDKSGTSRRLPLIRPPRPPVAENDKVPLAEAKTLWDSGAVFFLDARALADYAAGHIALAQSLPAEQFDQYFPSVATVLSPDSEIVVYCDGNQCDLSDQLMTMLREHGYTHVRVLVNGWTTWHKAGFPTEKGAES